MGEFKAHKKMGEFITFGNYIGQGRIKKGYSRSELVEKLQEKGQNVTEKKIKNWERDAEYPDINGIYALAEILEIHPNDLLEAKQFMLEART